MACPTLAPLARLAPVAALALTWACTSAQTWEVHDMDRPLPPRIEGLTAVRTPAPADALILFDGEDLDAWRRADGGPAGWSVRDDGAFQVVPGTGAIQTRMPFGDIQLHLEWMVPESEANESGQNRGNSGLFLMGLYEVQILESTGSTTYADGMAASMYGQYPPRVNAGAGLGKWNSYDVIFRAPRFEGGRLVRPAVVTVIHNGVVVHDAVAFQGVTRHRQRTSYEPHAAELPLSLQDHSEPVMFRNIWVRPLDDEDATDAFGAAGAWDRPFTEGTWGEDYEVVMAEGGEDAARRAVEVDGDEIRVLYDWQRPAAPFGYVITKDHYDHYDFEMEHRYGERRFAPRAEQTKNSGLLLHVRDTSEVWPPSFEYQVMQGSVGDAWAIKGIKAVDVLRGTVLNEASSNGYANAKRWSDPEDEQGWNRTFVRVRGDRAWFWVNGRLVNEFTDIRDQDGETLDSGRIGLQVEGAEITFRNVRIRPMR